jgi:hypothetical protein
MSGDERIKEDTNKRTKENADEGTKEDAEERIEDIIEFEIGFSSEHSMIYF